MERVAEFPNHKGQNTVPEARNLQIVLKRKFHITILKKDKGAKQYSLNLVVLDEELFLCFTDLSSKKHCKLTEQTE